jgi:hypothetical protein
MTPYTALSSDASRSPARALRSIDAVALLTLFTVAGISLGIATVIAWPTPAGVLMGAAILALTCAAGGVVTALVLRRDLATSEQEMIP